MNLRKLCQGLGSPSFLLALMPLFINLALSSGVSFNEVGVLSSPPECKRTEFSVEVNGSSVCKECSVCQPGEGVKRECSATSDTWCVMCKAGKRFSMEINGVRKCIRCVRCHRHQRVKKQCTPTSDTECGNCKDGYYWDGSEKCKACVACNAEMISQGYMKEHEECSSDQHERRCAPSDEGYDYIQEEGTSDELDTNNDPVPSRSSSSQHILEEARAEIRPSVVNRALVDEFRKWYIGAVTCSAFSAVFMVITLIACCVTVSRRRRRGRKHPIYRQPMESSQASMES